MSLSYWIRNNKYNHIPFYFKNSYTVTEFHKKYNFIIHNRMKIGTVMFPVT
jgi:hypothetical protein